MEKKNPWTSLKFRDLHRFAFLKSGATRNRNLTISGWISLMYLLAKEVISRYCSTGSLLYFAVSCGVDFLLLYKGNALFWNTSRCFVFLLYFYEDSSIANYKSLECSYCVFWSLYDRHLKIKIISSRCIFGNILNMYNHFYTLFSNDIFKSHMYSNLFSEKFLRSQTIQDKHNASFFFNMSWKK